MQKKTSASPERPEGFVLGSDVRLEGWHDSTIAIDQGGRAYCYVGYRDKDQKNDLAYYSPSVGFRQTDWRDSYRFIRLEKGALRYSSFLSSLTYYCVLVDKFVRFPTGTDSFFGVITRGGAEDVELTRQLFGATAGEYDEAVKAFGLLTGHQGWRYPSLTFSKKRNNSCDVTGCLIPRQFPYVAFDESQSWWSHVSLSGFCRTLAFLNPSPHHSRLRPLLVESGLSAEILDRLIDAGKESWGLLMDEDSS